MQLNLHMHTREKSVCSEVREAADVCICGSSSLYKSNIIVLYITVFKALYPYTSFSLRVGLISQG